MDTALLTQEVIYYPVPIHRPDSVLPRIAPRGPGGRPGSGFRPKDLPVSGRTVSNGDLTAISKPLHPDNFHQTIIQPSSPPDVRIADDLKLPNISLGTATVPQKPKIGFDLNFQKPTQENTHLTAEMATPVAETNVALSNVTALQPTNAQPKMPIPSDPLARPIRHDFGNSGGPGSEAPEIGIPGDGRAVLIIGVDPSGLGSELALPPGNRSGDFSIAPETGTSGSPGGRSGGVAGGGSGGNGRGGDGSVGVGLGRSGGGGGDAESSLGSISIKGRQPGTESPEILSGNLMAMVYPVPSAVVLKLRRNALIVSAGPMGGGGLDVYGALDCGKIYTIFLPMPGANWTMQYCQRSSATTQVQAALRSGVIHLEPGLVPPDPDTESMFDFQRGHVPQEKEHKMILLKGTLRDDGVVENLHVYQGVTAEMDQAAALAFSRWKFKPAMKENKAVSIEILVGIPAEIGGGQHAR